MERAKKSVQNTLRVKLGLEYVDKMLEINEGMQQSIDHIFTAIVRESWTAFECLAGDLWAVGVRNRARGINTYAASGKESFLGVAAIKEAYGLAFGAKGKKVFSTVANGEIFLLSAFRNVMTHSPGKASKRFVKQLLRFPEFKSIKEGDAIVLDGALVRRLRMASALVGDALIHLVDDIITPPSVV
jgi:hypothetical protein